jgi:hypothetical protein
MAGQGKANESSVYLCGKYLRLDLAGGLPRGAQNCGHAHCSDQPGVQIGTQSLAAFFHRSGAELTSGKPAARLTTAP